MEKTMEISKDKEKVLLGIMTVAIAICSSTFAAEYGNNFDWRYSLLFFVSLGALTFHYAKFIPRPVLSAMRVITIIGLVLFTVWCPAVHDGSIICIYIPQHEGIPS
jgi:hypothetical protein